VSGPARMNPRLGELSVDPDGADVTGAVLERLHRFGIAALPAMFADRLSVLRADFDAAFESEEAAHGTTAEDESSVRPRFGRTETGRRLTLDRNAAMSALLPGIYELFSSDLCSQLSRAFLDSPMTLNRHVILTDDYQPSEQVLPFHFDELNSLKCYLYLDDVDERNAPFQAIPGTQAQGKLIRQAEWLRVDDFKAIRSLVFEEFSDEFFYSIFGMFKGLLLTKRRIFTAPAGTVLVFDTDMLHSAGALGEGRRRRVVRGTSYRGVWPWR
jgi:hypothetical protein